MGESVEKRLLVADQLLRECVLYRAGEQDGLVPDWVAWGQRYADYAEGRPQEEPDDLTALAERYGLCRAQWEPGASPSQTHTCGHESGHDGSHRCPRCGNEWSTQRPEAPSGGDQ